MNTCEATPSAAQEIRIQSLGTPEIDSPLSRNLATAGERRVVFTVDEELVDEGAAPRPMSFELAAYGLGAGLLYRLLPHRVAGVYGALAGAMLIGRVSFGIAMFLLLGGSYTWEAFVSGAFVTALPGIILHLLLIPPIVLALQKAGKL